MNSTAPATQGEASFPIIVIGMHRSGTTLLSRTLTQMGVAMGENLSHNHEEPFFSMINDWLMSLAEASWANPSSVSLLLENAELRAAAARHMRALLRSPHTARARGWAWYRASRFGSDLSAPTNWGWKDPRNTFTLPLWLDLFPNAKVLHIYRNGIDVARSLQVRAEADVGRISQWVDEVSPVQFLRALPRPPITISLRCLALERAFELWEQYTATAESALESLLPGRALAIQYEEFLASPADGLRQLDAFLASGCSTATLESIASQFRPDRGEAYKSDPDLVRFRESVKDRPQMQRYGY